MAYEKDEIVKEIDVYLTKENLEKLWILQFPVRPVDSPYDPRSFITTKIKPVQRQLHVEIGLDTSSDCYSQNKGEHYAMNVDGPNPKGQTAYPSGALDKMNVTSCQGSASCSRYALGILNQGALHLSPLSAIVQMRPELSYLDKAEAAAKQRAAMLQLEAQADESSQDEEEPEVKAVTLKYSRPESEEQRSRRLASFEYLKQKQSEENWITCTFNNHRSREAQLARESLISKSSDISEAYTTNKDYLATLIPPKTNDEGYEPTICEKVELPENVLSQAQLRSLPLNERIKLILLNAKVIRWSQLVDILGSEVPSSDALKALQHVAVLVRGCWVVKSELLYPKGTFSSYNNSPADIMCKARDYLLHCFTQTPHVNRKDISHIVKIPSEELKEMLEQISQSKPKLGWVFFFEFDQTFVSRHKEVVQRQQMLWEVRLSQLSDTFTLSKGEKGKKRHRSRSSHSISQSDQSDHENKTQTVAPPTTLPEQNETPPTIKSEHIETPPTT